MNGIKKSLKKIFNLFLPSLPLFYKGFVQRKDDEETTLVFNKEGKLRLHWQHTDQVTVCRPVIAMLSYPLFTRTIQVGIDDITLKNNTAMSQQVMMIF